MFYDLKKSNTVFQNIKSNISDTQTIEAKIKNKENILKQQQSKQVQLETKGFPYRSIMEHITKHTPQGVMVLSVFDDASSIKLRAKTSYPDKIEETIAGLNKLGAQEIKVTEMATNDNTYVFELSFLLSA